LYKFLKHCPIKYFNQNVIKLKTMLMCYNCLTKRGNCCLWLSIATIHGANVKGKKITLTCCQDFINILINEWVMNFFVNEYGKIKFHTFITTFMIIFTKKTWNTIKNKCLNIVIIKQYINPLLSMISSCKTLTMSCWHNFFCVKILAKL